MFSRSSRIVLVTWIGIVGLRSAPLHAADKASRIAGEATYHSAGCEQCHGADWSGTDRGPDLRGVGKRLKREEIEKQVECLHSGRCWPTRKSCSLSIFLKRRRKHPRI